MPQWIARGRIDRLPLTVRDIDASCQFYESVLGMRRESLGTGRVALHFGRHKINPHPGQALSIPRRRQRRRARQIFRENSLYIFTGQNSHMRLSDR